MKNPTHLFGLLITLSFHLFAFNQTGQISADFNHDLYSRFADGSGADGFVNSSAIQPDGKLLIGGSFRKIDGIDMPIIARLNTDGSLDQTFHLDSDISVAASNACVTTILIKSDGKILIGGIFANLSPNGNFATFAQLNSDGSVDADYITPSIDNYPTALILLPDGDVLVGNDGSFSNSVPERLNPDGTIDNSFNSGTGFVGRINSFTQQPDGKILIAGEFTSYNGTSANNLIRVNADGSIDPTFNIGSGFDYQVRHLALQPDGKIMAVGSFGSFNGTSHIGLIRLNSNGSYDNTFNVGGTGIMGSCFDIAMEANGDFIVVGAIGAYNGQSVSGIVKFNSNGVYNPVSANIQAYSPINIFHINRTPDGNYFIGGDFSDINNHPRGNFAQLTSDLEFISTFSTFPGANNTRVSAIEHLSNGNILIGGDFFVYNDTVVNGLVELTPSGNIDNSFTFLPSTGYAEITDISKQPNGQLILAGSMNDYSTIGHRSVARINSDGSFDNTFDSISIQGTINKTLIQPDGKILVGGDFSDINGQTINGIVRLNYDGTIDPTFNVSAGGISGTVYEIVLTDDGNILVGGYLSTYNGNSCGQIIKLHYDGSIEGTFICDPTLSGSVQSISIQSDQTLLIGGNSLGYGGNNFMGVLKLTANGTIVPEYIAAVNSQYVYDTELQPDGKLLVGGQANIGLRRLNSDGTLDNTFIVSQSDSYIRRIALASNGKIAVGGFFKLFQQQPANRIVVLDNDVLGFSDLDLSFSPVQNVTCSASGSITAAGNNGIEPYTYDWHDQPDPTNPVQTITEAGIYTCTITDNAGHSVTRSQYIDGPVTASAPDFQINLISGSFRTGFNTQATVLAKNLSCISESSQITVTLSPLTTYISADPAPTSVNGNTLTWDYSTANHDSANFVATLQLNTLTTAVAGDLVEINVEIEGITPDADTTNNTRTYSYTVLNGYDPNEKQVYPLGKCDDRFVNMDDKLTYTVRFQNTGNSEAINISVMDSLDVNLDLNTLKIVGSSHEMWPEIQLDEHLVVFHFDSILLPDSASNEPGSHGYVVFEITPIQSAPDESIISNKVEIYFDFNEAIITNTVQNTLSAADVESIVCNLNVSENTMDDLLIYPNPTDYLLNINLQHFKDQSVHVSLRNSFGQLITDQETIGGELFQLNVSNLPAGIYDVQINNIHRFVIVE